MSRRPPKRTRHFPDFFKKHLRPRSRQRGKTAGSANRYEEMEECLGEERRGSDEDLRMPDTARGPLFDKGQGESHLHKRYERRGHDHGSRRMHDDAKRAMVGIATDRMDVRYLGKGEQRQQNQTYDRDRRKSTWIHAAAIQGAGLECGKQTASTLRIHRN